MPNDFYKLANLQELYLKKNQLKSLPAEITNLINLQKLDLSTNSLISLPNDFYKLVNLQELYLSKNQLKSLPVKINNLINLQKLYLDESSYEINNLDMGCEILILGSIRNPITNLPCGLKKLYLSKEINIQMIKIPFECEIKYDLDKIITRLQG